MKWSVLSTLLFTSLTVFAGPKAEVIDVACSQASEAGGQTCISQSINGKLYFHWRTDKFPTSGAYYEIKSFKSLAGKIVYLLNFVASTEENGVGVEKTLIFEVSADPLTAEAGTKFTVEAPAIDDGKLGGIKHEMTVLARRSFQK
ncbi:MAG: hypothetical protein ABL958_14435 [Bdellovibrionia bacterium]